MLESQYYLAGIRAKQRTHHQDSGAKIIPRRKDLGSLRDVIRLSMSLPTLRETRASMTRASPKPSIIYTISHLVRKTNRFHQKKNRDIKYKTRNLLDGPKTTKRRRLTIHRVNASSTYSPHFPCPPPNREKKTPPLNALIAKQHRASSSETPTHSRKKPQASSRAVLPDAAIRQQPSSCTGEKPIILRDS